MLRTYAMRMLRQPSAMWPDAMMMMGDQLYADQAPKIVEEIVGDREVHSDGPVEVLEDFEEYTVGYWDAWTHPYVRWMLSTMPSSMIFDDHEINDKWKTSQAWLDEMRQTDWYADRVIGGLMAYWIYQHLGNLSPAELGEDETYQAVCDGEDAGEVVRDMAERAEKRARPVPLQLLPRPRAGAADHARLAGGSPARAGQAEDHERRGVGVGHRQGRRRSPAPADGELAAVPAPGRDAPHRGLVGGLTDGAWGERFSGSGRRSGSAPTSTTGPASRASTAFEELVMDIATGQCGEPPDSLLLFGGDVHHCWVSEVDLPEARRHVADEGLADRLLGPAQGPAASERTVLHLGHTWLAAMVARLLAASAAPAEAALAPRAPTSATRSAPSRSPGARSGSGSSGVRRLDEAAPEHGDRAQAGLSGSEYARPRPLPLPA